MIRRMCLEVEKVGCTVWRVWLLTALRETGGSPSGPMVGSPKLVNMIISVSGVAGV